uniref:Uncharacterized protein n=1 Tax=Citrobacter freundii TaxID=546 RepID=A0A3Q9W265_CITFR|nr:Hypothetical protein [Citrobacter freundii]
MQRCCLQQEHSFSYVVLVPVHNHLLIFDVLKVQPADVWARKASLSG